MGESWTSYVEFGRIFKETHPQFESHRKRSTAIWLELRKKHGCSETKYSHKISCKYWPRQFHEGVQRTIEGWRMGQNGTQHKKRRKKVIDLTRDDGNLKRKRNL